MSVRRTRSTAKRYDTRALLLRRVDYGESDLVVTLFTEELGKLSALARGARKSQKRFGGSLEPMHTLRLTLEEHATSELFALREARLDVARTKLVSSLEHMEAAGRALGWVRRASPVRTPEPEVWQALDALLGRLEHAGAGTPPRAELAHAGLALLAAFGWGLDLGRCVSCGKPCPEGQGALVDVARGGLVCRACGGARAKLSGELRGRMQRAEAGESDVLVPSDVDAALDLVDRAFRTHLGIE